MQVLSRIFQAVVVLGVAVPLVCQTSLSQPSGTSQPKTALDWLRRADDLTDIRIPESAPFRLKVTFHAYPGIDFTRPGQSPIQSGDGSYEETWLAPKQWRREVTLGSYHAVEVFAGGVRQFQASSDYEPSRVMMLMNALFAPVPRFILEDDLQEKHIRWKLEHLSAGNLAYVRISYRYEQGPFGPDVKAFEFLPNGILVRSEEDQSGLLTSWQDDAAFSGKLVPRHLSVRGAGLSGEMVTAEISVEPVESGAVKIAPIGGDTADPGSTLQPLPYVRQSGPGHFETPGARTTVIPYPPDVKTSVTWVYDRHGDAREAELSGVRVYGQPPSSSESEELTETAMEMVEAARKDHFLYTVDGSPCQFRTAMTMWPGHVTFF